VADADADAGGDADADPDGDEGGFFTGTTGTTLCVACVDGAGGGSDVEADALGASFGGASSLL
jgi:hypothetical protein